MTDDNPHNLRDRADRYQRIARQMNDAQAVQFNNRAEEIEAAASKNRFALS